MDDQKATWNEKHTIGQLAFSVKPSEFGLQVVADIKPGDKVLELGCALGGDGGTFAKNGAEVIATDYSEVVIGQAREAWQDQERLSFELLDIASQYPYADASFDVVYARLALHYWDHATTVAIFAEIARVLKPGGRLYFSCKSEKDPMFGDGEDKGDGVFIRVGRNGPRLRHFFSPAYVRELLSNDYELIKLEEAEMVYAGDPSAFVEVWAVKE